MSIWSKIGDFIGDEFKKVTADLDEALENFRNPRPVNLGVVGESVSVTEGSGTFTLSTTSDKLTLRTPSNFDGTFVVSPSPSTPVSLVVNEFDYSSYYGSVATQGIVQVKVIRGRTFVLYVAFWFTKPPETTTVDITGRRVTFDDSTKTFSTPADPNDGSLYYEYQIPSGVAQTAGPSQTVDISDLYGRSSSVYVYVHENTGRLLHGVVTYQHSLINGTTLMYDEDGAEVIDDPSGND